MVSCEATDSLTAETMNASGANTDGTASSDVDYKDLASLDNNNNEQQEKEKEILRVHVYREDGFNFRLPVQTPTFRSARPSSLPAAIDVFLWGGLTSFLDAMVSPAIKRANRVFFGVYLFGFLPLFGVTLYFLESYDSALLFFLQIFLLLLLNFVVAWAINRPKATALPHQIEEALLQEVVPHFRAVGYDLVLDVRKATCLSAVVCVRIVPLGSGTTTSSTLIADPPTTTASTQEGFRVAVCGRNAYPTFFCSSKAASCPSLMLPLDPGPIAATAAPLDPFTWGAVATEIRPLALQVQNTKAWQWHFFILTFAAYIISGEMDDSTGHMWSMMAFITLLTLQIPLAVLEEDPMVYRLASFVTFLRASALYTLLDHKVQELSPLVAARTGYDVSLVVEPDDWCRSSWGAYLSFQPCNTTNYNPNNQHTQRSGPYLV